MNTPETEIKREFLQLLLEKNPDLKNQFEAFLKKSGERSGDNLLQHIKNETEELIEELETSKYFRPGLGGLYTPAQRLY